MGKLGRLWARVLPELICLSATGAIAYYIAELEEKAPRPESKLARHRPDAPKSGRAVIALARP